MGDEILKKLLISLLIGISVLGVSCGQEEVKSDSKVEIKQESVETENEDEVLETAKVEEKKPMTVAELNEALNSQPMKVISTEYIVQHDEYKALYPDMLSAVIQNNSGTDVKNAVVGFVAWDSNNFPVKIEGNFDYNGGSYFKMVDCGDVNMVNGATFGEGMGMELSENNNISKFKAIVVSYTDFDGNTWNNPLLSDFKELYADKKLVE